MNSLAEDASSDFLSLLSHTLLTPLTAIVLRCDMLLNRKASPEAMERALVSIDHSARAQVAILENLVELARFRAGTKELARSSVNLATCIKDVVGRNASAAREQKVSVIVDVDASGGTIQGDPVRLGTAIFNLVNNAVRFTPPEGRVDITVQRTEKGVAIRVTDTGAGLRPDAMAGLFEPPTFSEKGHSRRASGMGLGLPVTRWIAELHGGSISCANDDSTRGASFTLELPRAQG